MRNIILRQASTFDDQIFGECERFQEDCTNSLVYIATKQSVFSFDLTTQEVINIVDWEVERSGNTLIDFQFLFDSNELCAVLSTGSIIIINVFEKKLEEVAFVGIECSAASWSTSLTYLAVSDGQTLLLYDRDFMNTAESNLLTEEIGRDELVTVGWGSKETQFQGSAGKLSARKNNELAPVKLVEDTKKTYIVWRADDQCVFVSVFNTTSNIRSVLVFDSEGQLASRLKNEKPLEECIAVRPTGNYIATFAPINENFREIMFFEKNGELRHTYKFPCNGFAPCIGMKWNSEASILAIIYRENDKDIIEAWCVSNYEWNLKWSYVVKGGVSDWNWSSESGRVLFFATADGGFFKFSFEHEYSVVNSMAVVIATGEIRVTDLAKHPIPPPMCQFSLPMEGSPLAFTSSQDRVTVIYNDLRMETHQLSQIRDASKKFILQLENLKSLSLLCYSQENKLLGVINGVQVVEISLETGEVHIVLSESKSKIVWLGYTDEHIYIQTENGHFEKIENYASHRLFDVVTSTSYFNAFAKGNIFTLVASNELYKNGKQVADSVSSFITYKGFCIYITLQNKLMINSVDEWVSLSEARGVEIGSRLVDVSRDGTAVTMQMPRGNLETIHPRLFVVELLRQLIDDLKYVEALKIMKKHRIDMNLLCDHNPEVFSLNINKLLIGSNPDLVNLFIASLTSERNEFCKLPVLSNKIQFITEKLCSHVLDEIPTEKRIEMFTVLLSALLKNSPPKTEEALKYVKQHTDEMPTSEKDSYSRKWLHHISFFVNDKAMFNAALATYDLSLTVQVAEASNRDPKEYLPILNELRKTHPEEYKRYRIDILREDWKSALWNLSKLNDRFDEATELIKNKCLHSDALQIYVNNERFKDVAHLCAAYLESKGNWTEAMILYEKAADYEKAVNCCVNSRDFNALQRLCEKSVVSDEEKQKLYLKIALQMKLKSEFRNAAHIYASLGNDRETVNMLISAGDWEAASNYESQVDVLGFVQEQSLLKTQQILEEIDIRQSDVLKYIKRLEVVRFNKEKLLENLKDGIETGRDLEDCDAFSEAASTLSMISRRTGKTSSSRASTTATIRKRKQIDRKKQSLKEGGEYEDSALLLVLKQNYKWFNDTSVLIKSLSACHFRFLQLLKGKELQKKFSIFRAILHGEKHHIWPNKLEPKHLSGPVFALYSVDNVFTFPAEGGMPNNIIIEPEMVAPELVEESSYTHPFLL